MRISFFALASLLALLALLAACGGGGSGSSAAPQPQGSVLTGTGGGVTAPVTIPTGLQLGPGSSHTMAAGETVLVPAGTTVTTTDNSVINLSGHNNTVHVGPGRGWWWRPMQRARPITR
jgi:hypothetical protein